jgi:hypothetical protein
VPVERLRKEWHTHRHVMPITHALGFTSDGLVMGAGTVLVPVTADRSLQSLEGQETRLLALLSAAYGHQIKPSALKSIELAGKHWEQGEDCLALIHLALAGFAQAEDRREAARRLFMADGLIKSGIPPEAILQALNPAGADSDLLVRYLDTQPRVPAGSGAISGRWTKIAGVLLDLTEDAAKFLARTAAVRSAVSAARNPYILAAGILLIPKPTHYMVEGEVTEIAGLRYAWNRDETTFRLTYDGPNGSQDILAQLGPGGLFRDGDRIVARELPDGTVAVDPAEVSSDLADKDGPNLCPKPVPDKYGRGPIDGEKDKDYEDQIKLLVNPDNPTPRGYGYQFWDDSRGKWVVVDDCQHQTGMRVEAKGGYDGPLNFEQGRNSTRDEWLDQSRRQLNVSRGFELTWVFAKQSDADFAKEIFNQDENDERKRIRISVVPRLGGTQ